MDNSGPAFPRPATYPDYEKSDVSRADFGAPGMTYHDWIVGQTLVGAVNHDADPDEMVDIARAIADSVVRKRAGS